MNEQFFATVNRFTRTCEDRVQYVVFGVAKELHERLVDITPYRTGRARASWNISAIKPDNTPAPDIGIGTNLGATPAEIAAANVFYDSLIASKQRFRRVALADLMFVTNTVHYIERLNNGSSKQAPAGFFNAMVASAGAIANRVVAGIRI